MLIHCRASSQLGVLSWYSVVVNVSVTNVPDVIDQGQSSSDAQVSMAFPGWNNSFCRRGNFGPDRWGLDYPYDSSIPP
jgi:hypothetical protein